MPSDMNFDSTSTAHTQPANPASVQAESQPTDSHSSAHVAKTVSRLLWLLALVSSFTALFAYGILRNPNRRDNIDSALLGQPLPAFSIPLFPRYHEAFGDTFHFAPDLKDRVDRSQSSSDTATPTTIRKPIVLNFWAAWCTPCRSEAPVLEAAWQRYQDDVIFLGINTQQRSAAATEAFLQEFAFTFPNGLDSDSRLGIDYGIFGLPETFFISADGTLVDKYAGPLTPALLTEKIEALLATSAESP